MRKLTLIAVLTLAATIPAVAQAGSGAKYGSRDPKPCPPANFGGAPSAGQASQLFTCATEKDTGDTIYLVGNVQVQVASSSRSFQPGDSYNDIDPHKPIYPIRGSFTYYSCRKQFNIDASHTNVGKNCSILQQPHAQGICYKTAFGDWTCKMTDPSVHWDQATTGNAPPK
jgi:hypothetical protein